MLSLFLALQFAATVEVQNDLPIGVNLWGRQGWLGWVDAQSHGCFRLPRGWLGLAVQADVREGTLVFYAPSVFIVDGSGWHLTVDSGTNLLDDLKPAKRCGQQVA